MRIIGRRVPPGLLPARNVIDFQTIRLARALHSLGEAVGADVGRPVDMLRRLETWQP